MEKRAGQRCVYLDLFKYFLCYLVIAIHLTHETYSFFPLYRLAVPMFFIISGYFNYCKDSECRLPRAIGFIHRTLRYLFIGFAIYIVFDFVGCLIDGKGVGYYFTTLFYEDFLLEFVFLNRPITYTGAQLWFLIALFMVSLVHFALVRFNKLGYYKIIVPVCYLIYFFFAGYMYLVQDTDMPIRYTRNAWFFGLPCFGVGYLVAGINFHKKSWYKYIYLALGVACFFLQIFEDRLLRRENTSLEMYVTGVLAAVFLLLFFLGIKNADCPLYYKLVGKNAPFYIYILHMAVSVVLSRFITFSALLVKCLAVLIVSFAIYEMVYLLYLLWEKKIAPRLKREENEEVQSS